MVILVLNIQNFHKIQNPGQRFDSQSQLAFFGESQSILSQSCTRDDDSRPPLFLTEILRHITSE